MSKKYDINYVREQFPAVEVLHDGVPVAILDGPGGTQVPKRVVEKINNYLYYSNANEHGAFKPSIETEALVQEAREIFADFFGCSPDEVAFGANSTTNNFMLAHALRKDLKPGDEVIITEMDHICNQSPWAQLEDMGAVIKSVRVNPETCQLDFEDFKAKLSPKTKILAINYASNGVGTVTDVKKYIKLAHEVGAITIVDAVHYAPHKPIDVKEIGTDILICSPYKFFGPHLGVVYIRKELFDDIKTVKVDADDILDAPFKFQTGTPNFENICGSGAAVEFIADIGEKFGEAFEDQASHLSGRRKNIVLGMLAIDEYEEELAYHLRTELKKIDGVTLYGPPEGEPRTTTVSFTIEGINSHDISKYLGDQGIYTWDGDFYAVTLVNDVLKLTEQGGLVRIGVSPYNTSEDINRTINAIKSFVVDAK